MNRDRIVQLLAPLMMIVCFAVGGTLLPRMIAMSDAHAMRYTNVSVEGAPPWIAIGTAIGALRGVIVDALWLKINHMKEKGLYYEVMADAELITKLQPRFPQVWAFHAHNMAYNISVATHTQQERWDWVNSGIHLMRDEGLRYNPNDLVLHKELAFFFAHKIEGLSDDAHFYYKQAFCREWHLLLGQPPDSVEERIAWLKKIADAPESLNDAERAAPGVKGLVDKLKAAAAENKTSFELDRKFVAMYVTWQAVTQQSAAAAIGNARQSYESIPYFKKFDALASDPTLAAQWDTLIAHARKRVLKDEYNMDPALMYRYSVELQGPIDWRHGQAHALYWSRRGSEFGQGRISDYDVYMVLNNDRLQMQAMQDLARWGRINFDMFSSEPPTRFPDSRWVDVIIEQFDYFYTKHYDVRGAGGESFIAFLQNFMGSAIRSCYRRGETARAQKLLDKLDERFGSGAIPPNPTYQVPLDVFVMKQVEDQYQNQPHLAPSEVAEALRYGIMVGIGTGSPDIYKNSLKFADQVIYYFRENKWSDYTNKFGVGRIKDVIADLESAEDTAFIQVMTDSGISLEQRRTIWALVDRVESEAHNGRAPVLRALAWDRIMQENLLPTQFANNPMSQQMSLQQAFPAPPGLDQARSILAERQKLKEQREAEERERAAIERKS